VFSNYNNDSNNNDKTLLLQLFWRMNIFLGNEVTLRHLSDSLDIIMSLQHS